MKTTKLVLKKSILNKLVFSFFLILTITACNSLAQKNEMFEATSTKKFNQLGDSVNKPKISYKVNKQVDKEGRIIKYDSSYTYVYKGGEGKGFSALNTDSLFNSFNIQPFKLFDKQSNSFFNSDLFLDEKIFEKQMQFNTNLFNDFFKGIDSIPLLNLKNKPSSNYKKI